MTVFVFIGIKYMDIEVRMINPLVIEEECVTQLNELLHRELRPGSSTTLRRMKDMMDEGHVILCAYDGNCVVGIATLLYCTQLTLGRIAFLESVVVDKPYRRNGIGETLTKRLIAMAKLGGASKVRLTSNPERLAAHALYEKLGFIRRITNVYDLELK